MNQWLTALTARHQHDIAKLVHFRLSQLLQTAGTPWARTRALLAGLAILLLFVAHAAQ